ncbi:MAG: 2Fe-2S iron-sulfur cluster binding domain-containing protein [Alphaproteobacteria bacterium]|nr:2Fe-2S iron-sulfur cluster binding domain-containing protein [Alphaproteobacteria bacterium]
MSAGIMNAVATGVLGLVGLFVASLVFERIQTAVYLARSIDRERALLRQRIGQMRDRRNIEKQNAELSWNGFRKFVIARKVMEGGDICSFYLQPHDNKPLPGFQPGQFLTFRLFIGPDRKQVIRCYSLSDRPREDYYRVSIKKIPPPREPAGAPGGLVSSYFHDQLKVGDIVDVKAPSGGFYLDMHRNNPAVLIGGGVGITPVLSMLNAIVESGQDRETWFFLGIKSGEHHVFKEHLARIAREHPNVRLTVCYSDPEPDSALGTDYHHRGHVGIDLFKSLLPSNNYDYYFCGPPPMMNSLAEGLEKWGVPASAIHYEAFGPATVKKVATVVSPETHAPTEGVKAIAVQFSKSQKTAQWTPGMGSVLELAEANGVHIDSGCRAGNCGTCLTAVKSGEVIYPTPPGFAPESGSCLVCVAMPKAALTVDA